MNRRLLEQVCIVGTLLVGAVIFAAIHATPSAALPPGRAWTPLDTLKVNGHEYMVPDRFEPPRDGRIELLATGYHGELEPTYGHRTYGLVWGDSSWSVRWSSDEPAYTMWPALTTPDRQMLVWKTTLPRVDSYYSFLVTADVVNGVVTAPDTIARVAAEALVYSGTAWGSRRWVAVRDREFSILGFPEVLRIYRSDAPGAWQLMGPTGMTGRRGMRLVALDSSNVMLLTSDFQTGVRWGYLRDTLFQEQAPQLSDDVLANRPALARTPGGGLLAAWDGTPDEPPYYTDRIVTRKYTDGSWAAPDTLAMRLPPDRNLIFSDVQFSPEGAERPALTWSGYSSHGDAADYVWASFPMDSGFGIGERIEGSRYGVNPKILRDENGDIWVVWWELFNGLFWLHSHTTVTASTLTVMDQSGRPSLRWQLNGPAPETWWAVLRAEGDGPLAPVARVRATSDTVMGWSDSTPPAGVTLRYAIRRECRDLRYQITSEEARWEPRGPSLSVARRSGNPGSTQLAFDVVGANRGALEVRVYDLQGREVLRRSFVASGAGRDAVMIDVAGDLRTGLYLMRASSPDGRMSPTTKIAIVR